MDLSLTASNVSYAGNCKIRCFINDWFAGEITLASANALDHPIIWSNDLAEPRDEDVLVSGLHVLLKIANSNAMKSLGLQVANAAAVPECSDFEFLSDDYFRCAVHINTRTENHQTGSCKMGPSSDPLAVVDPQLRVHGIQGLRIADASIPPKVKLSLL